MSAWVEMGRDTQSISSNVAKSSLTVDAPSQNRGGEQWRTRLLATVHFVEFNGREVNVANKLDKWALQVWTLVQRRQDGM